MKHANYRSVPWSALLLTLLIVPFQIMAQSPTCVPPPAGLVSWWPGDGSANDIAGSNRGTLRNGVAFAAGKVGPTFIFDGVNDSILVENSASLNLNEHTIDAWINPGVQQGSPFHGIVVKQNGDNSGRNYYLGLRSDGRVHYSIAFASTTQFIDSLATVPTDTWTHVAATFDGGVMRLFINGQESASLSVGNVIPSKTTQPLLIGHTNENAATFFKGLIDEIELFNRALSAGEIQAIFNADRAGKCRDCRQVYTNNFDANTRIGPEWRVYDTCDHERCNTPPRTANGESYFGQYRFFDNESCTPRAATDPRNINCPDGGTSRVLNQNDAVLTLASDVLGMHNTVAVSFELYIIGRWDGSQDETWELRHDTGNNTASTRLALRRFTNSSGLQKHAFNFTFRHPNGRPLRLVFSVRGVGPVPDSAWGVDNLAVTTCSGIGSCAIVSAASYTGSLASETIAAAFGSELADATVLNDKLPLPIMLGGTSLKVRDSLNVERLAPLFFVSPSQVNLQIPPGTANGTATVNVVTADGSAPVCVVPIFPVAPGLFTADASGRGFPAAEVYRFRGDSLISREPVARFNSATNRFDAVPIDLGLESDQVILVLYGTGIRGRSSLSAVTLTVGGLNTSVQYAGAQGTFVGLDQVNALLPRGLLGRSDVEVNLSVDGQMANTVKIFIR